MIIFNYDIIQRFVQYLFSKSFLVLKRNVRPRPPTWTSWPNYELRKKGTVFETELCLFAAVWWLECCRVWVRPWTLNRTAFCFVSQQSSAEQININIMKPPLTLCTQPFLNFIEQVCTLQRLRLHAVDCDRGCTVSLTLIPSVWSMRVPFG